MAFRGDYRGDVTTVLFIQPKQCDITILMLPFGLLSETRGNKVFIAGFDHFSHFNRLSRYVRAPIIVTIIILSAWSTLFTPSKDEFALHRPEKYRPETFRSWVQYHVYTPQ